jgi:hypothetical protein
MAAREVLAIGNLGFLTTPPWLWLRVAVIVAELGHRVIAIQIDDDPRDEHTNKL